MANKDKFLLTQEVRKHFSNYLYVLWKFLGLPEPTPIQYEMAEWVQNGPSRSLLIAFRGAAKSWITGAYVTWCLWNDPRYHKFTIISAGEDRANQMSQFIKRIIETFGLVQGLVPKDPSLRWKADCFDVQGAAIAQAPSVNTVGINGQLTGGRPTDIIFDDIEIPRNSMTVDMRDKLFKVTEEFAALLTPGGTAKGLGTPQTEESVYTRMVLERGYRALYIPVRAPEDPGRDNEAVYRGCLSPRVLTLAPHEPTDPLRFSNEVIASKEAEMGHSGFKLHFMLDTTMQDKERSPLRLSDLVVMDVSSDEAPVGVTWSCSEDTRIREVPAVGFRGDDLHKPLRVSLDAWRPYEAKVMAIDPSGRGKDQVGYCCAGILGGRIFVMDYGGLHGGYSDANLKKLVDIAVRHKISTLLVEDNFGDGMFSKLMQPYVEEARRKGPKGMTLGIQGFKVAPGAGHKHKRIVETMEPIMNAHRLIVDLGAIKRDVAQCLRSDDTSQDSRWYCGLVQMTRVFNKRDSIPHDDILEAMQMACEFFSATTARDTVFNEQRYAAEEFDKELKKWLKGSVGFQQSPRRQRVEPRGALGVLGR